MHPLELDEQQLIFGAKVALVARSKDALEELSRGLLHSFVVVCDMSQESDVRKMIKTVHKHFGRIDILINNAGRGFDAIVEHIDIVKFRKLIELNLIAPLIAMQEVIPIMKKQLEGTIVNISSGTSLMNIPGISAYSSLKKALNGISLTAREELQKDHVTVSVIYPYITATNFGKNVVNGPRKRLPSEEDSSLPPADSPDLIAEKILEAITTGKPEIFAHDWMK